MTGKTRLIAAATALVVPTAALTLILDRGDEGAERLIDRVVEAARCDGIEVTRTTIDLPGTR